MLLELIADWLRKDEELAKIADVVNSESYCLNRSIQINSINIQPHDEDNNHTIRIGIVANNRSDISVGHIVIHVVGGNYRILLNPADPKFTPQDVLHAINRIIPIDHGQSANKRNLYTEYGFQYLIGTYS